MISGDKEQLQKIKEIQSFVSSSSSDAVDVPHESIDPSSEVAEPHLLLEENLFPTNKTTAKNTDSKRIHTSSHDTFRKEQQPQKLAPPVSNKKSTHATATSNTQPSTRPVINSTPIEQQARRTVTFDNTNKIVRQSLPKRSLHKSNTNFRLSDHDLMTSDEKDKESTNMAQPSDSTTEFNQTNIHTQNLDDLVRNQD
jgi:hypothetical protein